MPRQRRSNKRKPRRMGQQQESQASVNTEMKELIAIQRQQLRYGQPNMQDVIFPQIKQKKYTFAVNVSYFNITGSTTAAVAGGIAFQLQNLNLATSFTQLFDRYRILMVQLQFNPLVVSPTGPALITAIDYDDASTPSLEISQRDTSMFTPVGTYFERTLAPRLAVSAYGGSTFSGYANMPNTTWIDANSPNVQYYGLKYYLPVQTTATQIYNVSARILVQFKNNF